MAAQHMINGDHNGGIKRCYKKKRKNWSLTSQQGKIIQEMFAIQSVSRVSEKEPSTHAACFLIAIDSSVVVCSGSPALHLRKHLHSFLKWDVLYIVGTAAGTQLG